MKVKISDRESDAKMKRWMDGEENVWSKNRVNTVINDIDMALLKKRVMSVDDMVVFGLMEMFG